MKFVKLATPFKFGKWYLCDDDPEDVTLRLDILKSPNIFDTEPSVVIGAPQDDGTMYYYILDENGDEFYDDIPYPEPSQSLVEKCLQIKK